MGKISYEEMGSNTVLNQFFHNDGFVQEVRDEDTLGGHDSLEAYYDENLDEE